MANNLKHKAHSSILKLIVTISSAILLSLVIMSWVFAKISGNEFEYITQVISDDLSNFPIILSGKIIAEDENDYYFRASGTISKIFVDLNSQVKKGDLLASLDFPEDNSLLVKKYQEIIKTFGDPKEIRVKLSEVEKQFNRKQITYEEYLRTKTQAINTLVSYANISKELERLNSLQLDHNLYASSDGMVTAIFGRIGGLAQGEKDVIPVMSITKTPIQYLLEIEILDHLIGQIKIGNDVQLNTSVPTSAIVKGQITTINKKISDLNKKRYYSAIAKLNEIDDETVLASGMRVEVEIKRLAQKNILWIPRSAFDLKIPNYEISKSMSYVKKQYPTSMAEKNMAREMMVAKGSVIRSLSNDATQETLPIGTIYLLTSNQKIIAAEVEISQISREWVAVPTLELKNSKVVVHYKPKKNILLSLLGK